jgi:hypothetical protein
MDSDNQLAIAFESVSIVQLAHELGFTDLREGAGQRSPFREDRKAGSFSVQRSYFKDHAHDEHSGGHIKFVELAKPAWSKKECIEFIIRAAGMEPERQSAGTVRRVMNEKRERLYTREQLKVSEIPKLDGVEPPPWPGRLRERWNEGQAAILEHLGDLAESRGWPAAAMRSLIGMNKTSLPLLPWCDDGGNRRGWGWLVEKPVFSGARSELVPVGFHSRYKVFTKGAPPDKRWVYCPYVPERQTSNFQRWLADFRVRLPAYPFVLGDLSAPRLVVILEGQFDAVSFALAWGWLAAGLPPGVVVMGLRGVSSPMVLLAAYGPWLRRNKPFVWLIGDNDEAGRRLVERKNAARLGGEPSFVDRLRAQGCTVAGRFYAVEGCKDFNDLWRAHAPDVGDMERLAAEAGCLSVVDEVRGQDD